MERNENELMQYMVEFDVPQPLTEDHLTLIPEQKEVIDALFVAGKMLSYSLAVDKSRVWALILAQNESELLQIIDSLPMSIYMDFDYHELMFHNTVHLVPAMSLN